MLELSDKDFKAAVRKCFDKQLETYLKQMKNGLSEEIEDIRKNHTKIFK